MTDSATRLIALERASVVASLIQGEVLAVVDACCCIGDAAAPLCDEAVAQVAESGVSNGLIVVPHAVDEVVLVTQTCDLQETTSEEPHCLVAPVLKVSTDSHGR